MLPLFRAVLVWAVILATVILPRLQPPAAAVANAVAHAAPDGGQGSVSGHGGDGGPRGVTAALCAVGPVPRRATLR